jgi:deoxyribodipyrimidine photolyase-related protein
MKPRYHTLRLILGDQLNAQHSWFHQPKADPGVLYVMMEVRSETDYVCHHVQKVLGFFAAMRGFAAGLTAQGHTVQYLTLDDPANRHSFAENCRHLITAYGITHFAYLEPDEWRVDQHLLTFSAELQAQGLTTSVSSTEHFYTQRYDIRTQFAGKKTYLMESFYRKMRVKHRVLMDPDGVTPLHGRWNFDAENRKKLPASQKIPAPQLYRHDVTDLLALITKAGVKTIGTVDPQAFHWPITREEGLAVLQDFLQHRFSHFGDYQDAITTRDWLLFHSRVSFSLNVKLISPAEVVNEAIAYAQAQPDEVAYAALEGFVRQILGWREYMRGIYWAEMPGYASLNALGHTAALPQWYWTGQTQIACLRHAISQSLEHGYAHHIQRLMVTGNFALLLGVHPDAVDDWYLGIYIDALQWVEITNTRGMSQFADGGIVGTKPYASTANYIHKMGDACTQCAYDRTLRHGPKACPFNALYWDFYDRHAATLRRNPRIGMAYMAWDKMEPAERAATLTHAAWIKENIDSL